MTLTFLPIWIVDVGGAVLMILLSFLCVRYARRLRHRDSENVIWTYLLWVSLALAVFAVSRSVGHILKQVLIASGHPGLWTPMRPYSGAINTMTFVMVGSVTLFFERNWATYQKITRDRHALRQAHKNLVYLNQNLEHLVSERTAALASSEQRYRRIFEASKDMIVTTSRDGGILDVNPAGRKMLGLAHKGPVEHVPFSDFFANPVQWRTIADFVAVQGFVGSMEIDLKTVHAVRQRVLLSGSLSTEEGDSIHFLVKDIEQQHVMREQMAQADKLASIGELSAGIAHEINNPLGIILGYTQLMMRHEQKDNQRYDDLKTVEKHVRHCKAIVEDLLNFARTSKPRKERLDIHAIVDEVAQFIQQHARTGDIRIEKVYDSAMVPLLLDEKKMKQVLINLVMNAVHAIEGKGIITVRTKLLEDGGRASICIEDTGCGIDEKNQARIFDPFFTTKPTGEGTGLGLSVSYGIIRNHGGEISVKSRPGEGTVFTISLPVNPDKEGR